MNAFAFAGALTCISSLVFGFFVFSRSPSRRLNQLWLAFAISVALWGFGSMWIALESNASSALWAWRSTFALSVIWIPILYLHFTCIFCEVHRPNLIAISYLAGILFLPVILASDHFFSGVRFTFSSFYYAIPGPLFVTFLSVMWIGLTAYSHCLLIQAFQKSSDMQRAQIKYFFMATGIGYAGGSLAFLPIFGIDLYPWGHFAIPLYPIIMAYAIMKYRLMDTSIVLEKGLTYLSLFSVAAIPTFGILLWAQQVYFGSINYTFSAAMLLLFHLLVLGSYTIKARAEETIRHAFFKQRREIADMLSQFSKALVTILDFTTLTNEITQTLKQVMGIRHATLYVWDKQKNVYDLVSQTDRTVRASERFSITDALPLHLRAQQRPVVRDELEHLKSLGRADHVTTLLQELQVDVCLPFLNTHNQLIGFCTLGPRHSEQGYTDEDLQLLASLGRNAAIALDNAILYGELKQSQLLIQRHNQLRSLKIMAGGFAHEIRNPLTSIKTFVQLAPQRIGDQAFLREFGRIVTDDVTRIERLTQEILNYSQHSNPQCSQEDFNAIVNSCVYTANIRAMGKNVVIKKDLASGLPSLRMDQQQMKQVLTNLLFNALEAMEERAGTLSVRTYCTTKMTGEKWVQVEIADTGHGIPPKELEHIFDPFFTTKHQSHEREGTGLGLTIAHQIIQSHGGSIEVTSREGHGTTFIIALPVAASQDPTQMSFPF